MNENTVIIDNVNHPAHYENSCSMECIDVMIFALGHEKVVSFCLCNAFKYLWRFKNKNGNEDILKAKWYLDKADELLEDARFDDTNDLFEERFFGNSWEQYERLSQLLLKYDPKNS